MLAFQSSCSSSVEREGEDLLVKSVLIRTDYEASAQLIVDARSFKIKYARWDVFRSPDGYMTASREVPELIGLEAYLNSGIQMRQAVGTEINGMPLFLMAECIKGMVQAETFLIFERGFSSLESFDEHWEMASVNSCRYYSNLDLIDMKWTEYMGEHSTSRNRGLFYRNKSLHVFRNPDGSMLATAGFIDSFHEIVVRASFSKDGLISECLGNFLRGPDKLCLETLDLLPKLIGKKLAAMSKKEIAVYIGGPCGCSHLLDIFSDLGQAVAGVQG